MTLGERIVHYRKRQGLSQEQLSQRLGVSRQSVSKWERDESLPEATSCRCLPKHWACLWTRCCPGRRKPRPSPPGPRLPRRGCGEACLAVRRWGWVGGLVLAAYGAFAFGLGLLARFLMGPMFPPLELLLQAGGPCARPLWGSKSSPWPSWWWAGWPLLGNHRGGRPLPQAARREEVNRFYVKHARFFYRKGEL